MSCLLASNSLLLTREMPEPESILDAELDAQLRGLFAQAEKAIETRSATAAKGDKAVPAAPVGETGAAGAGVDGASRRQGQLSLVQLLKPLALGLETLSRATGDNTTLLKKLDAAASDASEAGKELPGVVAELRTLMDARSAVSQNMFAALHEELKGYKDGFLLDSVHRPIIRDLISLFDDVAEIQRQVAAAIKASVDAKLCGGGLELVEKLRTIEINIEHNMGFITEVLNRLEVTLLPPHEGRLNKQTQRAVAVELAEDPDEDTVVVRSVKRGFLWKDRVFRAEEVVIKKWKEGFLVALAPENDKED